MRYLLIVYTIKKKKIKSVVWMTVIPKKKKEKKKNGIIVFLNKYKNFVALFFFVELNFKK